MRSTKNQPGGRSSPDLVFAASALLRRRVALEATSALWTQDVLRAVDEPAGLRPRGARRRVLRT